MSTELARQRSCLGDRLQCLWDARLFKWARDPARLRRKQPRYRALERYTRLSNASSLWCHQLATARCLSAYAPKLASSVFRRSPGPLGAGNCLSMKKLLPPSRNQEQCPFLSAIPLA
jgi:hypothetical protein